jgi:uncharacterized protein DUF4154
MMLGSRVITNAMRRWRALVVDVCFGMSIGLMPSTLNPFQLPVHNMPLAIADQGSLILKVVSSDDDLRRRRDELRLGILFLSSVGQSTSVKDELVASLPSTKVGGRTLRAIPIPMTSADELERAVDRDSIDILYVTPGLDNVLNDVLSVSRKKGVLTVTGVPEYVDRGVTVGFVGESRFMQVAVNLKSARNESRRFDTSFLDKVKTR